MLKPTKARLAIEVYRHMLMHEGVLHGVIDQQDRLYQWYLAWNLDPDEQCGVAEFNKPDPDYVALYGHSPAQYLVHMGTMNLVAGVSQAFTTYISHLHLNETCYHNYLRYTAERWEDKLRWTPRL